MQEERAGGQAPLRMGDRGAGDGATAGVGTRGSSDRGMPEILHLGRQQGVAGRVSGMETPGLSGPAHDERARGARDGDFGAGAS